MGLLSVLGDFLLVGGLQEPAYVKVYDFCEGCEEGTSALLKEAVSAGLELSNSVTLLSLKILCSLGKWLRRTYGDWAF
jgi:hypothetical protein